MNNIKRTIYDDREYISDESLKRVLTDETISMALHEDHARNAGVKRENMLEKLIASDNQSRESIAYIRENLRIIFAILGLCDDIGAIYVFRRNWKKDDHLPLNAEWLRRHCGLSNFENFFKEQKKFPPIIRNGMAAILPDKVVLPFTSRKPAKERQGTHGQVFTIDIDPELDGLHDSRKPGVTRNQVHLLLATSQTGVTVQSLVVTRLNTPDQHSLGEIELTPA